MCLIQNQLIQFKNQLLLEKKQFKPTKVSYSNTILTINYFAVKRTGKKS